MNLARRPRAATWPRHVTKFCCDRASSLPLLHPHCPSQSTRLEALRAGCIAVVTAVAPKRDEAPTGVMSHREREQSMAMPMAMPTRCDPTRCYVMTPPGHDDAAPAEAATA